MKIDKISLELSSEELEAIHYALHLGIKSYKRNKSKCADDWIQKAEEIRRRLPTRLHLEDLGKE